MLLFHFVNRRCSTCFDHLYLSIPAAIHDNTTLLHNITTQHYHSTLPDAHTILKCNEPPRPGSAEHGSEQFVSSERPKRLHVERYKLCIHAYIHTHIQ